MTNSAVGEHDEHEDDPLEVRLDGGCEERPRLPEEDRKRERERRDQAHLHRGRERLGHAERHELLVVGSGPVSHSMICSWNANVSEEERDDREERDDQPRAELVEVLDERCLLTVVETAWEPPAEHSGSLLADGFPLGPRLRLAGWRVGLGRRGRKLDARRCRCRWSESPSRPPPRHR